MTASDLTTTDLIAPSDTTPGFCRSCCAARDILRPGTVLRAGMRCHVTDAPECLECGGTDVTECSEDEAARREYQADQAGYALASIVTALAWWRQDWPHRGASDLGALLSAVMVWDEETEELHETHARMVAARDQEDAAQ
jgi:hypothetical protein